MTNPPDTRQVIAGGPQPFTWSHMTPIADFLIEHGHAPISYRDKHGFGPSSGGMICQLARRITPHDWAAIDEHFLIPDNIRYYGGIIRDSENGIDIIGYDEFLGENGIQPIEVWEEEERQAGRL